MNKVKGFLMLYFFLFGQFSLAESIADKLLVAVLEKKIPAVLYEHKDKPWAMGTYSLIIKKTGITNFSSAETRLNLSFPIEGVVKGAVNQIILGMAMTLFCDSKILTDARVDIIPLISATGVTAKVSMVIPVPSADLNCEGLRIPVKPMLEQLITDNKRRWESDLETDFNQLFQELGI